ncbi:hypothetical protein GSH05_00335 [Burkholderia pseudomallei]|nr:hypothetical protein CXQ84_24625 [Burkholderia pseudomallei]MBM5650158.1 hypothetical protein [Burkholderia pseudomallei]
MLNLRRFRWVAASIRSVQPEARAARHVLSVTVA